MNGWTNIIELKESDMNQLSLEKKLSELETRLTIVEGKLASQGRLGPTTETKVRDLDQLVARLKVQEVKSE